MDIQITDNARLQIEFSVIANHYTITTQIVHLTKEMALNIQLSQLLGMLYRHAIALYYPSEMTSLEAVQVTQMYADTSWSPIKLTTFVCQIVTQTHSFSFPSIMLIPESISQCTLSTTTKNAPSLSVHLQYKGDRVQIVVRKKDQPKLVYTDLYPGHLRLETCLPSSFLWRGSATDIILLLNLLWRILIVIL